MEKEIKELQQLNEQVNNLYTIHCEKKAELKELEAELYLFGEDKVKEALGKDKVSQKDKEYFIQLKTIKMQSAVDYAYVQYKQAQEDYKIKKMAFRCKHQYPIEL